MKVYVAIGKLGVVCVATSYAAAAKFVIELPAIQNNCFIENEDIEYFESGTFTTIGDGNQWFEIEEHELIQDPTTSQP